MKMSIGLVLLLALVASCGLYQPKGGQLRLVKVGNKEELVIERQSDRRFASDELSKSKNNSTVAELEESLVQNENSTIAYEPKKSRQFSHTSKESEKIEPEEEEPNDQQKISMAFGAERDAVRSERLFIGGLISVFMPYLGIILFGLGLYFYVRANNARFITPRGENRLRSAKIFLVIDALILLFWISMIVLLILLF
jgi:hypothetical protein